LEQVEQELGNLTGLTRSAEKLYRSPQYITLRVSFARLIALWHLHLASSRNFAGRSVTDKRSGESDA